MKEEIIVYNGNVDIQEGSNIWFSADYHFSHKNIIEYTNRPFSDITEMDNTIVENHNSVVKPNDHVYFLGDFSFQNG